MSERIHGGEDLPERLDPLAERVISRLERIGEALGVNLRDEYGLRISLFVDESDSMVAWEQFEKVIDDMGLRPLSLLVWSETYFDEQFDETVRIARERGSYNSQ